MCKSLAPALENVAPALENVQHNRLCIHNEVKRLKNINIATLHCCGVPSNKQRYICTRAKPHAVTPHSTWGDSISYVMVATLSRMCIADACSNSKATQQASSHIKRATITFKLRERWMISRRRRKVLRHRMESDEGWGIAIEAMA